MDGTGRMGAAFHLRPSAPPCVGEEGVPTGMAQTLMLAMASISFAGAPMRKILRATPHPALTLPSVRQRRA